MSGRLAMGFATKTRPLLFLRRTSTELIESGEWAVMMDGGVVSGAGGRLGTGGGVISSLVAAAIPKSNVGMSCGGDDRGFDAVLVRLAFF